LRIESDAATDIEARLMAHGFNQNSINAEAYHQAGKSSWRLSALIASAQKRRLSWLRELDRRRYCSAT
jgi:hypothetical protein